MISIKLDIIKYFLILSGTPAFCPCAEKNFQDRNRRLKMEKVRYL